MAMSLRSTISKSQTTEKTTRETLPEGTVRVKTVTETTLPDGRTVTEEAISIEKSSSSTSTSEKSNNRFTRPDFFGANFFQKFGTPQNPEPKQNFPKSQDQPKSTSASFNLSDYRQQFLRLQNVKRSQHNARDLVMSEKLNSVAQEWAENLAKSGQFQHRPRSQYGENIFMGFNSAGPIPPTQVVETWYSEVKNYDYDRPSPNCGHFTQMVWKESKEVGFGCAVSNNGSVYAVANYFPAGNMMGKFKENVERPRF